MLLPDGPLSYVISGPSIKISSMMSLSDRAVFRSILTLASASLNARSAWKPGGLPTTSPLSRPCPEKGERSTASTLTVVPVILGPTASRSEEHTSELQSLAYLVCRLLLEKKKKKTTIQLHKLYTE